MVESSDRAMVIASWRKPPRFALKGTLFPFTCSLVVSAISLFSASIRTQEGMLLIFVFHFFFFTGGGVLGSRNSLAALAGGVEFIRWGCHACIGHCPDLGR